MPFTGHRQSGRPSLVTPPAASSCWEAEIQVTAVDSPAGEEPHTYLVLQLVSGFTTIDVLG